MYNKNVNEANEKSPQTATSVHGLMQNTNRYSGNRAVSCFYLGAVLPIYKGRQRRWWTAGQELRLLSLSLKT